MACITVNTSRIGGNLPARVTNITNHLKIRCEIVCAFNHDYEYWYSADGKRFTLADGKTLQVLKR